MSSKPTKKRERAKESPYVSIDSLTVESRETVVKKIDSDILILQECVKKLQQAIKAPASHAQSKEELCIRCIDVIEDIVNNLISTRGEVDRMSDYMTKLKHSYFDFALHHANSDLEYDLAPTELAFLGAFRI